MVAKIKCKFCGEEVSKINFSDHEEGCYKCPKAKNLEGWLALFAIGLYISALMLLTSVGDTKNPLMLLYFGYIIYLIALMHGRSKKFPKSAIVGLWLWVAILIIESIYFMFTLDENPFLDWITGQMYSSMGQLVVSLVWTFYLRESIRVKNTFRN